MIELKQTGHISNENKLGVYLSGYSTHRGIPVDKWLSIADEMRGSKKYKTLMSKK